MTGISSRCSTSKMPAWPIAEREYVLAPALSGPSYSFEPIRYKDAAKITTAPAIQPNISLREKMGAASLMRARFRGALGSMY